MRVLVAAVGRLKQGPERELAERYRKRAADVGRKIGWQSCDVVEIRDSRADNAERRMLEESIAIANVVPDRAVTIILDERGEGLNSAALAGRLQDWRAAERPAAVFILGGADGLAAGLREKAELALAFGALTWPHQLVRVMLLEQLYRAATILSGHPYHRT
jgi:23S rRNA (pseudouridine1915-N3)-methyltransferase